MDKQEIMVGILLDENTTLSVTEVCQYCQISEEMLVDWLAHGLFAETKTSFKQLKFDAEMLSRIRAAHRLHQDLEVNIQGAILALDLLDEITALRDELEILKRAAS